MTKQLKSSIPVRRHRDDRGRFIKAPATKALVVEAEVTPVPMIEAAPAAEAPAPEAFVVPDLRVEDLVVRQGYHQIPHKEYKKLLKEGYGVQTLRQAIGVMVALNVRLPEALILVKADVYRPWMVGQLKVIVDHPKLIEVLQWALVSKFETWNQGWAKFPRGGKGKIGPLAFLVEKLNEMRKEGNTSIASIRFLAEAAKLLGWINQ